MKKQSQYGILHVQDVKKLIRVTVHNEYTNYLHSKKHTNKTKNEKSQLPKA